MNAAAEELNGDETLNHGLMQQLARIQLLLGSGEIAAGTGHEHEPGDTPIDVIIDLFGLSPFERDVLLLAAGVELEAGIAVACGNRTGRTSNGQATVALALQCLPNPHWSAFAPASALRRWQLVRIAEGVTLSQSVIRIDERILHFLVGINAVDARLEAMLQQTVAPSLMAGSHRELASKLAAELSSTREWPPLQFIGDDREGQQDVAAQVAALLALELLVLRAEDLPSSALERWEVATLIAREALLRGSALCIDATSPAHRADAAEFIEVLAGPVFVAAAEPIALRRFSRSHRLDKPENAERRQLWQQALGRDVDRLWPLIEVAVSQYRLSARSIAFGARAIRDPASADDVESILRSACRVAGHASMEDLAVRIEPVARWEDLVLPDKVLSTLRDIAAQVRHRSRVYDDWGFAAKGARGLGITVMFTGDSGTGKTMAAEVLANDLGLELYRIDLSTVVSKYIGETEKNLRRVFDAAETSGAILLFDEADALFGKRSDVKDSHDRYANIEVSYLLQRMEEYRGLAILTTNMKGALDRAFQRRLRFVVQFPFPDVQMRERIWRGVFPAATPATGLDFARLARLNIAGGGVRSIAMNAAFLAARDAASVSMQHLATAARAEFAKSDKNLSDSETRDWR
jgi:hypothetical protein